MVRRHSKKPKEQLSIANERIEQLFDQADKIFSENSKLVDRYVDLARKIAMKSKVKIPSKFKRKYCKHCYSYLMPSVNCRVRTQNSKLVYSCLKCKKFSRIPLK